MKTANVAKSGAGGIKILRTAISGLFNVIKAHPFALIITAIAATITIFSKLKQKAKEAKQEAIDAAKELKGAFSTDFNNISDNLSTLKGLEDESEKLSKGVDDYGNNISLTTDEYERYKEIVQTILGISPSLVAGYDNEGNAIANKNGLLAQSIALMEEEQRLKRKELTSDDNLWTIAKGSKTELQEEYDEIKKDFIARDLYKAGTTNKGSWKELNGRGDYIPAVISSITGADYHNLLIDKNYADYAEEIIKHRDEILDAVRNPFTYGDITFDAISDSYYNELENWLDNLELYCQDVKSKSDEFTQYLQIIPQSLTDYYLLDSSSKDFLSQWIRGKDFKLTNDTTQDDIEEWKKQIEDFTRYLASDENPQLVIEAGIQLNADSQSSDITVEEYKKKISDFIDSLGGIDEDVKVYIKTVFGIEDDESKWSKDVDEKVNRVQNILKDEYDDNVLSLSMGDLEIAYKISAEEGSLTWDELLALINEYKASISDISTFDGYVENVKSFVSGIDSVLSKISEQSYSTSISVEDFNSEELADYTSALEYNNGVLQLNAEKVREIANAKAEETIATNDANKAMAQTEYLRNAAEIERLRKKIADKNYATNESEESVQKNIDTLLLENNTLQKECNTYDLITSSLREATNAYNNWLNAQNASQRGDMFDDTLNAINRVNETLNDSDSDYFGRFGRTDYKAAVELIVPDSIDPEDSEKVNAYLKSVYDLFTYDDDGNYSGLNIANFCQKAVDAGLMILDESGENYQIAGSKTMEDFAEGMNLSLPLVQAMFGEMEEFGGEFSWADEANKTIGDLAVSANVAAENLRNLHSDMTITIDVSEVGEGLSATEKLTAQCNALDSTIEQMQDLKANVNVDAEEVEYANSIIAYCITQKQQLSEPAILDVDTTKVSETTSEAVSLVQEFQRACNDLELKQALGLDTTDAQAKVNELYSQITSSDNDALLALKLDTTSIETVKSSIAELSIDDIKANLQIDDTALLSYQPEDKQATVTYDVDTTRVDNYNPRNLSRTVTYYVRTVGSVKANGTANLTGTAKASGDWGTAQGGKTLTGELGRKFCDLIW